MPRKTASKMAGKMKHRPKAPRHVTPTQGAKTFKGVRKTSEPM